MGRRGPKAEPAAVKLAKGNSGRRPIGKDPEAVAGAAIGGVQPPPWLKKDGLAQWNRLAPVAEQMKLLTRVDASAFARYCKNFARWLELQNVIDDAGSFYTVQIDGKETTRDVLRTHPAAMLVIQLERLLESAEARFGLNPSDRQRIYAQRATVPEGDLFSQAKPPTQEDTASPPVVAGPVVGLLN